MIERAQATINLSALQHNFNMVKQYAPKQAVMAMIKANGYGHGTVRVAKALSNADAFGVACVSEGIVLRQQGIKNPIAIMSGFSTPEELIAISEYNFQTIIHHSSQLEILQKTNLKSPIKVWLKIDTGMHRLGFLPENVMHAYQTLMAHEKIIKPIGLMTHFADAENPNRTSAMTQYQRFNAAIHNLEGIRSVVNSAGIILWPQMHADWVRPGIMLYGASPIYKKSREALGLKPVMTLQAKVIAINYLKCNDAIGYGGTWICPEDMPVAVVAIGYGDGYPRHAKNGTPVLINGIRCQIVGRVSMDMITVDIRQAPQTKVGDIATLWGEGLPAEEIAHCADTISYTLFCGVTNRVKMVEVNHT